MLIRNIGGAADPNSGSACMIEMSKAFGALLKTGWQPKRTIVFASWDAEEYGLVGSTEWVEEYVPWIKQANVAYINLDTAVSGSVPEISATPDFHAIAIEAMKKVVFPYHGVSNVTLYDVWTESGTGDVGVLGSGSDYTAFLHNNGISSIDIGANRGPEDPIYHYHSNYGTFLSGWNVCFVTRCLSSACHWAGIETTAGLCTNPSSPLVHICLS